MAFIIKIGTTKTNLVQMPQPTKYRIEYEDESEEGAGRVESGYMYKKRKGTIRKASLSWQHLSAEECQTVFHAAQPEYVFAQVVDPFQNGTIIKEFYVGNRSAEYSSADDGSWSDISFNLTTRDMKF